MKLHIPAIEILGKSDVRSEPEHSEAELAVRDIANGLKRWELWGTLGWHDVRQRYRRSTIGPFWITLSMGIMIVGLSILWSTLFRQSLADYLRSFALGLISWNFLLSMLLDGCTVFSGMEGIIKQLPVPLSTHVYRMVWRNVIVAAHNMCIYVVIMVVFGIWPGFGLLVGAAGLLVLAIIGAAGALIAGILSARYRDIPPMIASLLQMIFFFSPILWMPKALSAEHSFLVTYNPVYYLIEIVRGPFLGNMPPLSVWLTVSAMTIASCAIAFALFVRFRRRIAYWI